MRVIVNLRWIVMVACGWMVTETQAQDFTRYNWYFGNSSSAIRFSRSDNTASLVTNQKTPFSIGGGGSAVASNPFNADLMFYTDGSVIYDISGALTPMPNGSGLTGNTAGNQPVAICPIPGAPNRYYVFTNSITGTVSFSIVDMTIFGNALFPAPATGDVDIAFKNQPIPGIAANSRSEAMLTIPHTNGTDYWLITQQSGTDNYTVTQVQAAGVFINNPIPGLTGGLSHSASNFAYHQGTGKISVSPGTINRNVAILNFDNTTGALSFDRFIVNTASTIAGAIYDTEWSPSGRFLYISRLNDSGTDAEVLQFDTSIPNSTLTSVLPAPVFRSYGLQLAPDTAIYHIYQSLGGGPFRVAELTDTDSVASLVIYTPVAFASDPNFAGRQFPSFSPSFDLNLAVTFTSEGTCSNVPTSFYPTVTPSADSLLWNFGDGSGSNDWSPIYTYPNGGSFNVTVTAFLNGQTATFSAPVTITQFDLSIDLASDTTACECELPINNGVPPCPNDTSDDIRITAQITGTPISTIWSNGDTGPVLTPDSAGYYYVVVTDVTGCQAYAGINVREYGLQDQRANIWYFGQNAGIDFNVPLPEAITGPINSPEGVAVISNRNGDVIFSTDGTNVFDRNDVNITPGGGLGGQPGATQSSIIFPVPGDETLYYIFTTQEVHGTGAYELRYSLFDVKMNNGDGGIVEFNQLLFSKSTERITGNGNWLIAHEFGNNSFRAYQITSAGIGNPVISSIGSDHPLSNELSGRGYMKLGGGNILAVAINTPGVSNVLELFDFDNATGMLSNFRTADLNSATGQVYGVELAGNKIFATLTGNPSFIREFYIDYQGNPVLITPNTGPIAEELGAIQLGPNGQLFVAVNNQPFLGAIFVDADTLLTSTFVPNSFVLDVGTQSTLGLPNFIQSVGNAIQPAGIQVTGFCLGDPTFFVGTGTDPIDEFEWSFGDGFGSTSAATQHTYAMPGDYIVTLRVFNRCGLDTTMIQNITIFTPPANPTFLPVGLLQPVLCTGDLTLEATPATDPNLPDLTFLWSTGETTRDIVVSQQSIVSVVITNTVSGCTSSGSLLVADNRPPVNLGADETLCHNSAVSALNALNPGAVFAWTINGAAAGVAQTQPVNSSSPGIFEYIVTVTDPITTCLNRDTVVFTFTESPAFSFIENPTGCLVNTGSIGLTILSPAANLFSYNVTGPSSAQGIDRTTGLVADPNLSGLGSGSYTIVVTDQISGCATTSVANINGDAFLISAVARQNNCDPMVLRVDHTAIIVPYTFRVINSVTATVVASGSSSSLTFFDTPAVPSGSYIIEMNSGGCSFSSPAQAFNQDPEVVITGFTVNGCTSPISVGVNGGTGWTWSGPNIVGSNTLQTISANPATQGNNDYDVTITEAGFCPLDTLVTVFVNNNIISDFDQTDACTNQITLTATGTPAAAYTYIWYRNGVQIPGGQTILANLGDNGINYSVEVRNPISGCVISSAQKTVFVAGDLQLAMSTTTPCTGSPFTLTATSTIGGTTFQWGVDGSDIPGATQPTLTVSAGGLYRVTGILPGCSRSIQNQIILFPGTPGALPQRAIICPEVGNPDPNTQQVVLDAGPNFVSYDWYQGGVQQNVFTQTFTAIEGGVYSVVLVNSYTCQSTDETEVVEECKPMLVVPNAFRPGSGVTNPTDPNRSNSDFWVLPIFIDVDGFQVFIFNRWGELVFQSNDSNFRWNGGYNNSQSDILPAGTYSYVVKYKSLYRPQDGVQEQRGGVLLVR